MSDQVRVNGNLLSWSSVVLKIDGERFFGVKSISSSQKRERSFGYGASRAYAPLGRTSGKYTPEPLKMTVYKHAAAELRKTLAAQSSNRKAYGNVEVPIFLQYVEDSVTVTEEFDACVVVSDSSSAEESPDPTVEEWEFSYMRKRIDGLTLYDSTRA